MTDKQETGADDDVLSAPEAYKVTDGGHCERCGALCIMCAKFERVDA